MQELIDEGKIRGWGLCNDNAYGLTACTRTAMGLGITPPCSIQGDFSLIDRKVSTVNCELFIFHRLKYLFLSFGMIILCNNSFYFSSHDELKSEENGVAEAASPFNENVGFMSYNALAGGMLTGKYSQTPAALDNTSRDKVMSLLEKPRGRMDTRGWGGTLYRYRTDAAQYAISEYEKIAKKNKMSLTELALRFNKERSLVTTTLLGHSNLDQLQETIKYFKKKEPLSDTIMWEIDRIHMKNRLPIFSSDRVGSDWLGEGEIGEPIP